MAFTAKESGTCTRCNGEINVGDQIVIYNRPKPRSLFHATCPDEGRHTPPGVEGPEGEQEGQGGKGRGEQGEQEGEGQGEGQGEQEGEGEQEGSDKPPTIDAMIDEKVKARVKVEIAKVKVPGGAPTRIEIVPVQGPPIDVTEDHPDVPRVIRLFMAGLFPYLWGDAGTGKTTALMRAATILGEMQGRTIGMEIDTLDRSTPRSAILGYRTPNGDPVQTPFTSSYTNGGLLIHDEMDNAPAYVQSILNTALANGHSPSAWGTIKRNADFFYCAAGNTPFRPTPRFPDRLPGSFAYMDRLYFLHWELDQNIERRACGRPPVKRQARKVETCSAASWGAWVEEVREWTRVNTPTIQVTPRATFAGLKALSAGETPLEVAHGLIFRGADSALTGKILAANPLPKS
jgi:hypothetical protein